MEITTTELESKIENGEKVLIDFYGKFCGPCKVMKPWFESVSKELVENNLIKSLEKKQPIETNRQLFHLLFPTKRCSREIVNIKI